MPLLKNFTAILFFLFCGMQLHAQDTLPKITVKNVNGRIIVSWMNDYKLPIANINIQRSYDSLKNYTTIGSVLNPQNIENGYTDPAPPYNKMYYRVFVGFEGGTYVITPAVRPIKILPPPVIVVEDTLQMVPEPETNPFNKDSSRNVPSISKITKPDKGIKNPSGVTSPTIPVPAKPVITYPSQRIFTARDQNVVISLPSADVRNYVIKFFDEDDKQIFELPRLKETYLIIEKVNFVHSGWFHFEIYEDGELIEKNKFYIPKDSRKTTEERKPR